MRRLVCPVSKARRKVGQSKRRRAICAFVMGRDLDNSDSDSMPLTPAGLPPVAGKDGLLPDLPPCPLEFINATQAEFFKMARNCFMAGDSTRFFL